jgi:hypothetical protein
LCVSFAPQAHAKSQAVLVGAALKQNSAAASHVTQAIRAQFEEKQKVRAPSRAGAVFFVGWLVGWLRFALASA